MSMFKPAAVRFHFLIKPFCQPSGANIKSAPGLICLLELLVDNRCFIKHANICNLFSPITVCSG